MEMISALPSFSPKFMNGASRVPNYRRTIPGKWLLGTNKSLCRSRSLFSSGYLPFHGSASSKPALARAGSQVESPCWIDVYLPEAARPYARLVRLEKSYGIWFMAWPPLWAVALSASAGGFPDPNMLALFMYYGFVVRCTICTINDMIDCDFDKQVARTKSRPLASGALTMNKALKFFALELFLCSGFFLPINNYSRGIGVVTLLDLFIYPLMKRITYWPQLYLGIGISMGILMAWTAINGNLDLPIVLPLFISCLCWTIFFDTIYAHQDIKDDIKAGIKSTAIWFGRHTKLWISGLAITSIGGFALSGYNAQLGWPFYAILLAAAGQLSWQILCVDLSDPLDCNRKFSSNQFFGGIIFAGILLGRLIT